MAELLFQLAAAGDVAEDQNRALQPAALVVERRGALFDGDLGLVAGDQQDLAGAVRGRAIPQGLPHQAGRRLAAAFFDHPQHFADGLAHGLGASPSGEDFGHRIEECDALLAVGGQHPVGDARQRGGSACCGW